MLAETFQMDLVKSSQSPNPIELLKSVNTTPVQAANCSWSECIRQLHGQNTILCRSGWSDGRSCRRWMVRTGVVWGSTTLAKKIVTAEIFMRLIRSAIMWYLATSTSICNASSRRAATASRVAVEPKLNIARYHMIGPSINLMNFSAVTIFLARVVLRCNKQNHWQKIHSLSSRKEGPFILFSSHTGSSRFEEF